MILMEWDQYSIVGFFVIDFIFFKILNYPITQFFSSFYDLKINNLI